MQELEKGSLLHVEADGRMVSVESKVPGEEGRSRKALNLVQRMLYLSCRSWSACWCSDVEISRIPCRCGSMDGADVK